MPLAHGNAEAADITTSFNENSVGQLSLVVIIEPLHFAAKRYNGLGGVTMAMDGHHRARLQGVEHTLALVGGGVAQVEVHPQTRGGLGLSGQFVKEMFIKLHRFLVSSY